MEIPITLGEHRVLVFPQRHARLRKRLGAMVGLESLRDPASAAASMPRSQLYYVLEVLVPMYAERCPEYEFEGYGSREDFEADKEAEEAQRRYREAFARWAESDEEGEPPEPPEPHVERYDEDKDRSPTPPEIIAALSAAVRVNGGEVVDLVKAYVGPRMLERLFGLLTSNVLEAREMRSLPSESSPPPSGASPSTSSTPTSPTSTESVESPIPA